jgi:hypothetical protein
MLINSKYVLLFETTCKESEQAEQMLNSSNYVIQNQDNVPIRVYYKYYDTFTEAIKDIATFGENITTANFQIHPRGRFGVHYIRIKLQERFGYLYDVNSAFGAMLQEKLDINDRC